MTLPEPRGGALDDSGLPRWTARRGGLPPNLPSLPLRRPLTWHAAEQAHARLRSAPASGQFAVLRRGPLQRRSAYPPRTLWQAGRDIGGL